MTAGKMNLPPSGHKPKFADCIETYFAKPVTARKKPATLKLERWALNRWKEHLGDVLLAAVPSACEKKRRPSRRLSAFSRVHRRAGGGGAQGPLD